MTIYIAALIINFIFAVTCGVCAERRGRSRQAWFIAGVFLGALPLIALLVMPAAHREKAA